ncbi:MAG TPA: hypothetical protein ENJ79_06465 [Gammaproteobacteria bacterium]|nr:hypothetical protein [Gammaproteobacteria bacterium]
MIQLALVLPLAMGGLASALWREHRRVRRYITYSPDFTTLNLPSGEDGTARARKEQVEVIDDAAELSHNQHVALTALALAAAGRLAFPPFTLLSIPLLGYSSYYFLKTIHRTSREQKIAATTIFELASVTGAVLTRRYLLLASLLTLSFSIRKWALQAGNIASIGMARAFNPSYGNAWVLRGGSELEVALSELHPNDIVVLHPGDIIRKNGVVVEGEGVIKQFSLNGIMQAIPKHAGDPVFPYTEVSAGVLHVKYT